MSTLELNRAAPILIAVAISLIEAGAQSLSFLSRQRGSLLLFLLAWLAYLFIVALLIQSYKYRGVGYMNVLWAGITTTLMILIGHVAFGERLTLQEWAGVVLIISGIVLMSI